MNARKKIQAKIYSCRQKMVGLANEIKDLQYQEILLTDGEQQFTEKIETVNYRENRKKVSVDKLIGRIHWKEGFEDGDTGEVITIERSQVVRVNGEWVV